MKRTSYLLGAATLSIAALGAAPAWADGTQAGTSITNTVTVDYQVGGVDQTASTASDAFTVDRKVNVTVAEVGGSATSVSPGQSQAVTSFQVTNLSNDVMDFALSVDQQAGGSAAFSGSDNIAVSNIKIYHDDGDGVFDDGDAEVTYLDELAADAIATVFVVADIPIGAVTGDIATVILTADARAGSSASALGAELTSSAANTAGVDTVLADGQGATDAQYDGAFSARDDYIVAAASLSVLKTSRVVQDPVSGTTDPKAIPGAVVEYCIAVSNGAGSATATNIAVSDPLPATLTFEAGSIRINGSVSSGACQADGVAGGSFDGTDVQGTLDDLAAGETRTLVFQATVN